MEILVVFMFASSLFFHSGIAATDNKTDPIEVEALDAILQHWNVSYKGNNGAQTWNINATNPCKGLIVDESNDERIYNDSSSNRGKLDIRCLCDKNTSLCNIIRLSAWDLHISVTIPDELRKLTKLVYLDLDDNSIQGSIPSSIGNLINLNVLYLSRNKFEEKIPKTLGNLTKMKILDLGKNNFIGEIPNTLCNLKKLETLKLGNNSFQGSIPSYLGDLVNLTTLVLSNNNFTGSIPINLNERQKQGLLDMSVVENPFLCYDCGRSSSNKTVIIIIAVICSIVSALAVIIFVVWKVKRRSMKLTSSGTRSEVELNGGSLQGAPIHVANKEFTYLELVTMTSNFNRIIGKGGFGNVYHGIDRRNGSQVAVKVLSNSSIQGSKEFQMEAQILTRIHHKNFVSLVGYCTDSDHLALVYEYMEEGNLKNLISGQCSNSAIIGWRDRLKMALEIAQGLNYLHRECQPAIVHRDIKTTNILLTRDFEVKIADFGLSKIFENGANGANGAMSTIVMGTFGYIDPEYYRTQKLNEKSDVYSFGIVLIELITGQPAVINQEEDRILVATLVKPMLEIGEIDQILDPKLKREYNTNSAKKSLEIAFTCIRPTSSERPLMFDVMKQLKECLEIEILQGNHTTKSTDIAFTSEDVTAPFAR